MVEYAPFPSTLLPPHFWATVDKATPSRTTNQEVVIVAREKSGVPCPIPVAASPVYTDVRDAKTESGSHFRLFVKRCNVFNHILSNGKGFAFLQMVDKTVRRPVSYATKRFASSSYEQWVKIEKSYESLWKAFDLLHPRRSQ